jgi:cytochrome c biogenesis protein CcdA
MTADDLRQVFALAADREQKRYAFLRQLLVLASGALTALVAFRAGTASTGAALWALRVAWVALGAGILSGAFALHGEVWLAAGLARQAATAAKSKSQPGAGLGPIAANLPPRYQRAVRVCYTSLLLAVLALVAHALLRD